MGLFKTKVRHPLAGLEARELRRGTQIPMVDVEPDFVAFARETKPRVPRLGHESPIALVMVGGEVVAYYDDQRIGRMDPRFVDYYADEFATLQRRKQYGQTVVYIKPEGSNAPHAIGLNRGTGAIVDGGIL